MGLSASMEPSSPNSLGFCTEMFEASPSSPRTPSSPSTLMVESQPSIERTKTGMILTEGAKAVWADLKLGLGLSALVVLVLLVEIGFLSYVAPGHVSCQIIISAAICHAHLCLIRSQYELAGFYAIGCVFFAVVAQIVMLSWCTPPREADPCQDDALARLHDSLSWLDALSEQCFQKNDASSNQHRHHHEPTFCSNSDANFPRLQHALHALSGVLHVFELPNHIVVIALSFALSIFAWKFVEAYATAKVHYHCGKLRDALETNDLARVEYELGHLKYAALNLEKANFRLPLQDMKRLEKKYKDVFGVSVDTLQEKFERDLPEGRYVYQRTEPQESREQYLSLARSNINISETTESGKETTANQRSKVALMAEKVQHRFAWSFLPCFNCQPNVEGWWGWQLFLRAAVVAILHAVLVIGQCAAVAYLTKVSNLHFLSKTPERQQGFLTIVPVFVRACAHLALNTYPCADRAEVFFGGGVCAFIFQYSVIYTSNDWTGMVVPLTVQFFVEIVERTTRALKTDMHEPARKYDVAFNNNLLHRCPKLHCIFEEKLEVDPPEEEIKEERDWLKQKAAEESRLLSVAEHVALMTSWIVMFSWETSPWVTHHSNGLSADPFLKLLLALAFEIATDWISTSVEIRFELPVHTLDLWEIFWPPEFQKSRFRNAGPVLRILVLMNFPVGMLLAWTWSRC